MKAGQTLLALLALALAACTPTQTPDAPQVTSVGAAGDAYCETVPSDPSLIEQWNKVCSPGPR